MRIPAIFYGAFVTATMLPIITELALHRGEPLSALGGVSAQFAWAGFACCCCRSSRSRHQLLWCRRHALLIAPATAMRKASSLRHCAAWLPVPQVNSPPVPGWVHPSMQHAANLVLPLLRRLRCRARLPACRCGRFLRALPGGPAPAGAAHGCHAPALWQQRRQGQAAVAGDRPLFGQALALRDQASMP